MATEFEYHDPGEVFTCPGCGFIPTGEHWPQSVINGEFQIERFAFRCQCKTPRIEVAHSISAAAKKWNDSTHHLRKCMIARHADDMLFKLGGVVAMFDNYNIRQDDDARDLFSTAIEQARALVESIVAEVKQHREVKSGD